MTSNKNDDTTIGTSPSAYYGDFGTANNSNNHRTDDIVLDSTATTTKNRSSN